MIITMYVYHNLLPKREVNIIFCLNCRKPLFRASGNHFVISNGGVSDDKAYGPSSHYIEYKCKDCTTKYQVLFQ